MWQYELEIDKYWVTRSKYFRLLTTVELGIRITDGNILLCHGISEEIEDKTIKIREYNIRTVYGFFNNKFTADCGSPDLNPTPITIDGSTALIKRSL